MYGYLISTQYARGLWANSKWQLVAPISSVTGIHPARQLSGDKLPATELLRRPPSRME